MGQRMLECVFEIREKAHLVEELRRLQIHQTPTHGLFIDIGYRLKQDVGTSLPITAAACSRPLSSGDSRSMRAANIACTVAGT